MLQVLQCVWVCAHHLMYIDRVGVFVSNCSSFRHFFFFFLPGASDTVSAAQCGCQGRWQCESREKRLGHSSCQRAWELQKTIPWRACESECVHNEKQNWFIMWSVLEKTDGYFMFNLQNLRVCFRSSRIRTRVTHCAIAWQDQEPTKTPPACLSSTPFQESCPLPNHWTENTSPTSM